MSTTGYYRHQCDVCGRTQDFPQGKAGYPSLTMEVRGGPRLVAERADLCSIACAERWMALAVEKAVASLTPPVARSVVLAPKDYAKGEQV